MKTELIPRKSYANWMLAVLVINILLCFGLIGLLLLIPIGAWQVIDAGVYASSGDDRRKPYLIVVAAYFILLVIFKNIDMLHQSFWLVYLFVIPYIIAFWYWSIVNRHANERVEEEDKPAAEIEDHLIV